MVVLDTSVIIDHLRQKSRADSALISLAKNISRDNLAISAITVQELYEGQSTKDQEEENFLLATIGSLKILPYTYQVAELAGKLSRDLAQPIEFPDSAIAATAIINGAQIFTLNKKDFLPIQNLEFYEI